MSSEQKEEEILEAIKADGLTIEFLKIIGNVKQAFEAHSNEKPEVAVETLEEAKRKIRELQYSIIKGSAVSELCFVSMHRNKILSRQAPSEWEIREPIV
jgi:hypothetical protein